MMELDDIRTFVEVVNQGGFAHAARRLGIAKSIVSRRIARLEEDLGVRLLNRSQRGISPTEAGMEFKVRGERILIELLEARDLAASQRGEIVGRLRLSIPLSFGLRYVSGLLASWSAAHPKLQIDAAYSDRQVDLLGERFDAAIRIGILKDSSFIARRIASVRLVLVAAPGYLARNRAPDIPADLEGHECLIYSGSRERVSWKFQAQDETISVLPSSRFWADSGEALLQGALAGLGVTALPVFLVADSLRQGTLIELLPTFALPREGLYVIRPESAYVPAKIRSLIDLLLENFGGVPPWEQA